MDNPLWQYSLDVYARDGVEALLLRLQEDCGLDVNLLLYAAWLGTRRVALTPAHRDDVLAATCEWRAEVVVPLRELRRRLRDIAAAGGVRERIKALELEAEAEQQRVIHACYSAAGLAPGGGNVPDNLRQVACMSRAGEERWLPLLEALAPLLAA